MKNNTKKFLILALSAIVLVGAAFAVRSFTKVRHRTRHYRPTATPQLVYNVPNSYNRPVVNYSSLLNDVQSVQLPAAKKNGIKPIRKDSGLDRVVNQGKLVSVRNSSLLSVHATYPYLTPEAYDLLLEVARRYQKKAGGHPPLRVTSCFRTEQYARRLSGRNRNAVPASCHLYGTTFDISYARMSRSQKQACAKALKELRDAGYLYVKYEKRSPCFHVTIRKPGSRQ